MPASISPLLSRKNIPLDERLIFALDVPSREEAEYWVNMLGDSVQFYKLGLQLLMTPDYFPLIEWLTNTKKKKVFADIKFFDIPETVASAVEQLARYDVTFATVHHDERTMAALESVKGNIRLLAVTVLTSLNGRDLQDLGFQVDVQTLVLSRARRALEAGFDGIISSGLEVPTLRQELGDELVVVVPGIRPVENRQDHKRTVNVEEAFQRGADYIVVGRPIREAANPREKAEEFQDRIRRLFDVAA